MKDDNNSANPKMEHFLEGTLDVYPELCFKSPSKDKLNSKLESLPLSWRRTPIMSPIGIKSDVEKCSKIEKTAVKLPSSLNKFTPLKDCTNNLATLFNSADKARKRLDSKAVEGEKADHSDKGHRKSGENNSVGRKKPLSAQKHHKFVSKIKKAEVKKEKKYDRSPLIPNNKVEGGLLSENSSDLDKNILPDSDPINRSSNQSNRTFSPKKALDFADKSAEYKGRNLFEDNYQ